MAFNEERRRFIRLAFSADVTYHKYSEPENERVSQTRNISKGGICLIVAEELKENELLELNISLPDEENPLHAVGRVAWLKKIEVEEDRVGPRFDTGIEFVKIKEEDFNKVEKCIFKLLNPR